VSEEAAPSNRGLIIAAICLLISVVLAFIGLVSVTAIHRGKCPPASQSSPSRPSGPSCLRYGGVQGVND
jgi:hypothetical protein